MGLELQVRLPGVPSRFGTCTRSAGGPMKPPPSRVRNMTGRWGSTQRAQGVVQMTWSSA